MAGEPFAFGTNVCAPPFAFDRFELVPRADLLALHPRLHDIVKRLSY